MHACLTFAGATLLFAQYPFSTKKRLVGAGGKPYIEKALNQNCAKYSDETMIKTMRLQSIPCTHPFNNNPTRSLQCLHLHALLLLFLHNTTSVSWLHFLNLQYWSRLCWRAHINIDLSSRSFISLVLNPRWLGQFFPNSRSLHDPENILYRALAGPASGLATTLFMALLPQIFKCIAYYEGTSSSLEMAERKALLFMWYFMLVTAFFGQYLATMLLQWYYHGTLCCNATLRCFQKRIVGSIVYISFWLLCPFSYKADVTHITQSLWSTMNTVATLIPSAIAPQWLNWIIIRYGFIWPGGYFFQINTFLTKISGMTCINRVVRGG